MAEVVNNMNWDTSAKQSQEANVLSLHGRLLSSNERASKRPIFPPYLKPPPAHLGTDDVDYLLKKGALSIPDTELRNAILRSYADYVHPILPILDLRALQASIEDPAANGRASLPVFQAVMFAGSAWVDIKYLRRLGFLTRKAARKAFYRKTRMLYDFDYEQDRICLVQTLLLLTMWWEGPNEQKDGWYWSSLSLYLATNDRVEPGIPETEH